MKTTNTIELSQSRSPYVSLEATRLEDVVRSIKDITRAINSRDKLENTLDVVVGRAVGLVGGVSGSVMVRSAPDLLRVVAALGNEQAKDAVVKFGTGISGRIAETRQGLLINGRMTSRDFAGVVSRSQRVDSSISVPLIHRSEVVGVLNVNAPIDREFDKSDAGVFMLVADQAAIAIANDSLARAQREASSALLERGITAKEILNGIRHDLCTPITTILGSARVARHPRVSDEQRENMLNAIERRAADLSKMITDLTAWADFARQDVSSDALLVNPEEVVASVRAEMQMVGRRFEVKLDPVTVHCSPTLLRRALMMLIDNAFVHGSPPVTVRTYARQDVVTIEIEDCGRGVATDHKTRIFHEFFKGDPARTHPGIGLGLPLAKHFIDLSGGHIDVIDRHPHGSIFRVMLPSAESEAARDIPHFPKVKSW